MKIDELTDNYSVLMSVYKKEHASFLQQSIASILNQTVQPNDFVIVCDGELTPELDRVIASYKNQHPRLLNIVRLPYNQGLARALDYGLKYCINDIVARMDSDDIAVPTRCEKQLKIMKLYNTDIVGGSIMEFHEQPGDSDTVRSVPKDNAGIIRFAKRRNPFNHPSVMYRKSIVQKVDGYQPQDGPGFELCEDYYLWVRIIMASCSMYNTPEVLLYMRTGKGMHKRRGGVRYFFTMLRFKNHIREIGFSSWKDFIISIPVHFVFCLVPGGFRRVLYNIFLRKRW